MINFFRLNRLTCSMAAVFIFAFSLFLPTISFSQHMQNGYRIYSTALNKEVSVADIASEMKNADVLFFGEEHNDSIAHHLQKIILEELYSQYGDKVVLSLEMFDRDVQPIMNEYLADMIRERNFKKDARVWNNYAGYRPLVEFAKAHALPVICANAPSRYTNLAGRKGQQALTLLPRATKKYFAPLPYAVAEGAYREKLQGVMGHSAPAVPDTAAQKKPALPTGDFDFIAAQSLWDATMAWSIAEYLKKNKGKKVFQVNGRFHSDEKFAIVTQLQRYNPRLKTLVISSGVDEKFPNVDWEKHRHLGDYVIVTDPKTPKSF